MRRYAPIPIDRIRELYTPDFDAGTLTAIVDINQCTSAGTVIAANRSNKAAYQMVRVDRARFYLHRVLFALAKREPGDMIVDHIDGDTKNNSISNLRLASKSQNSKNRKTWSSTGLRGVYRRIPRSDRPLRRYGLSPRRSEGRRRRSDSPRGDLGGEPCLTLSLAVSRCRSCCSWSTPL